MVPRMLLTSSFMKFSHLFSDFKDETRFEMDLFSSRGLGNPILAIYVQMFLLRSYSSLDDINGEKSKLSFHEMLKVLNCLSKERPRTYEKITFEDYIQLLKPAINWISSTLTKTNSEKTIISILRGIQTRSSEVFNVVFDSLLCNVSVDFIVANTKYLMEKSLQVRTPEIIVSFGKALVRCPGNFKEKEEMINSIWSVISNFSCVDQYLPSAAVWLEFVAIQFETKEINKLLGVIIKKVASLENSDYDMNQDLCNLLLNIVKRREKNVMSTISIQNFNPMFSMITKEDVKNNLSKEILQQLLQEEIQPQTETPVHDMLMNICDILSKNVTALTSQDEQRQVSLLINNAIARCSLLPDFQKQLSFLSELRLVSLE